MITLVDLLPPIQAGVRGACFVWRGRDLTSSPRRRQKSLKNVPLDWYEHAPPRRTHHLTICIHCSERDMSPPSEVLLNLSGCPELQGVRIWTMPPVKSDMALVSSITSTSLRKVAFLSRWNIPSDPLLRDPCWQHIDDLVCDLVNRLRLLRYQHIWKRRYVRWSRWARKNGWTTGSSSRSLWEETESRSSKVEVGKGSCYPERCDLHKGKTKLYI